MKKNLFLVSMMLVTVLLSSQELLLKERAFISGDTIFFRDLLENDSDKQLYEAVKDYQVKDFSLSDRLFNITSSELTKILEENNFRNVKFNRGFVVVRRELEEISNDELLSKLENFLTNFFDYPELIVNTGSFVKPSTIPDSNYEIAFEILNDNFVRENIVVKAFIKSDDQIIGTSVIPVNLSKRVRVWRLINSKKRDQIIELSDLTTTEEIVPFFSEVMSDLQKIIGKCADRYLARGTVLEAKFLKDKPLIEKGDEITVELVNQTVKIKTSAIARQSGIMGQIIECFNPETREKFKAVVNGENTALITLSN
ncbi:MAG: flagellar basal body P-ring formation chaperone FlgA [Candidatus Cloacimonetes bacterium]|nr:flagellar basal body P-ring formation chaperone FlgA [Candidatus Cloacimonadota bacterium]